MWVRELTLLAYPFRLLLTIVHELSHGVAAKVTGESLGAQGISGGPMPTGADDLSEDDQDYVIEALGQALAGRRA